MENSVNRYIDVGEGTLFRNSNAGESRPSHTGKIEIDGKQYRLAAWVRESKSNGAKFFSLKVTKTEELENQPQGRPPVTDEEIPF